MTATPATPAATTVAAARPSLFAPLGVHDFRVSLAIQLVSSVRQPMQFFTQAWFINSVAPTDQRVAMLGLLATLQGVSYLAWVLFGSALSDRVPRRTALIVTHLAGAAWLGGTALMLRVPSVVQGEGIWFWIMLVVFAEFGVMNAQDIPARTAVASETVPPQMRTMAITLHWLVFACALLIAAPSTGWLIGRIGFANIYLIAMGSHLLTVVGLRFLRAGRTAADPDASHESLLRNVYQGIRYLRTDATMRWAVLLTVIVIAAGSVAMGILIATWISDMLHLDAAGWGRLALFWGAGGVLANGFLVSRGNYRRKGLLFLGGATSFAVAVLVFSQTRSIPVVALTFIAGGGGSQLVITVGSAMAQQLVPSHLLGRVMGLLSLAQGVSSLSGFFLGLLGQAIGLELLYPALGVFMLAITALTAIRSPLRHLD